VTVSGGEPLSQHLFVKELFSLCRRDGIHTAIETSGHASVDDFKEVLQLSDYVLFDLKSIDSEIHQRLCGRGNKPILENARTLVNSGIPFVFRMPIIPNLNDSEENLTGIGAFINELKLPKSAVELMPYHRLGAAKYNYLGREYLLKDVVPHTTAELQNVKAIFEKVGIAIL
jgi:pyruvate formate lyase activating enzyme